MESHVSFGRWLQQRRKALDLTQAQLAQLVGCAGETIRKFEADARRPSRQLTELLATKLEVPPAELPAFVAAARATTQVPRQPAENLDAAARATTQVPRQPRQPAENLDAERVTERPAPALPLNNLPCPITPLIDRTQEVARVRDALQSEDIRLLVLNGPPGIGKTRLGLQVAGELQHWFDDGVVFVGLVSTHDPGKVAEKIAQAIGIGGSGEQSPAQALMRYLCDKQLLIVLDSFEQVIAATPLVVDLLSAAPRLKILATSRIVLRVIGEQQFPVPPLALPDPRHLPAIDRLRRCPSVDLFVQRARAVNPDFMLTEANASAVAAICVQLDGLPLAIEVAAACSNLFTPQSLLTRLKRHLQMPGGTAQGLWEHQQLLHEMIAWSYKRLRSEAQLLFARLGVFEGGCTEQAARQICADPGSDIDGDLAIRAPDAAFPVIQQMIGGLSTLLDHSLLRSTAQPGGEPRFIMLRTIRKHALEQLAARGELEVLHHRHAAYFLALAESSAPELIGQQQLEALERLELEHDNLRAALLWTLEHESAAALARFSAALWRFWYLRDYVCEGRRWLEAATAGANAAGTPPQLSMHQAYAQALLGAGVLASAERDFARAQEALGASYSLYRAASDRGGQALALYHLGDGAAMRGDTTEAIDYYQQSLALGRELADAHVVALALKGLGAATTEQGDPLRARVMVEESLSLARALGDAWVRADALGGLGDIALRLGDADHAYTCYNESLVLFQKLKHPPGIAHALQRSGDVALAQGNVGRATRHYLESLSLHRSRGERHGIAQSLEALASVIGAQGQARQAAHLWGQAEALREGSGSAARRVDGEHLLAGVRAQLGPVAFAQAWSDGRTMTLNRIMEVITSATTPRFAIPSSDAYLDGEK